MSFYTIEENDRATTTEEYLNKIADRKIYVDPKQIYRRPNWPFQFDVAKLKCDIYLVRPEYSSGLFGYNSVHMYTKREILSMYHITEKELEYISNRVSDDSSSWNDKFCYKFYSLYETKKNNDFSEIICSDVAYGFGQYKKYIAMPNK